MNRIIYVPLEILDARYTKHLDKDICDFFQVSGIEFIRIYPEIEPSGVIPSGMFLNAGYTTKFKSLQLAMIADLFQNNLIKDDDVFFFSDLWFPGIESIQYMKHFYKKNPKITGILHAGSFTDTDEVRNFEWWAKDFEQMLFNFCDKIFVATNFMKNDLLKKRFIPEEKIRVTSLPLDFNKMNFYKNSNPKKRQIVFTGRNHPEKQPELFFWLKNQFPEYTFIWTQELNLDKTSYYKLLSESMVVISFALQENFGYGVAEAVYLGCVPFVPDRLSYQELYPNIFRYSNNIDILGKLTYILDNLEIYQKVSAITIKFKQNSQIFQDWFL